MIVTSGLSKAYGIPGVRIGWLVGPADLVDECWTQHDYLTIGPNKMSDRIARIAVEPANREQCYSRTREILRHNLPIAREWVSGFGGRLTWKEPQAGAIGLVKYDAPAPSLDDRRPGQDSAKYADCSGRPRRHGGAPAALAGRPGRVPAGGAAEGRRGAETAVRLNRSVNLDPSPA